VNRYAPGSPGKPSGNRVSTLVFIHGPNGVGKSTVCEAVHRRLPHSAWLESEWCRMVHPFVWNEEIIALTTRNLTQMLTNYLTCAWIDVVIFSYGFHGPRQGIWNAVVEGLQEVPYRSVPITLTCTEEANAARMTQGGRDANRIRRALATRDFYDALPYPRIDTTHLTVEQAAERVIELIQSDSQPAASR
jgi:hypothetical protein